MISSIDRDGDGLLNSAELTPPVQLTREPLQLSWPVDDAGWSPQTSGSPAGPWTPLLQPVGESDGHHFSSLPAPGAVNRNFVHFPIAGNATDGSYHADCAKKRKGGVSAAYCRLPVSSSRAWITAGRDEEAKR